MHPDIISSEIIRLSSFYSRGGAPLKQRNEVETTRGLGGLRRPSCPDSTDTGRGAEKGLACVVVVRYGHGEVWIGVFFHGFSARFGEACGTVLNGAESLWIRNLSAQAERVLIGEQVFNRF